MQVSEGSVSSTDEQLLVLWQSDNLSHFRASEQSQQEQHHLRMPSDVHMHPSAQQHRAQTKLILHDRNCSHSPTSDDNVGRHEEAVYGERYHALRTAGFEHETATKYAATNSSVTQVIDNILSQSLIQQLAIEKNDTCKSVEALLSNGQRHLAGLTQNTNLKSIYDAKALHLLNNRVQSGENDISGNGNNNVISNDINVSSKTNQNINKKDGDDQFSVMRHLQENDNFEIADKSSTFNNYLKNSSFENNQTENNSTSTKNYRKNSFPEQESGEARLSEFLGLNFFNNHELGKFKAVSDLVKTKSQSLDHFDQYKDGYIKIRPYFEENCLNAAFNRNLLVTVLKDGCFDPDEAIFEDEGVGAEQNMISTSSSASLSSSGASSLLLDSSSSPSSFSSLSSSISTTPPDALNGFESSAILSSSQSNALFAFHHNTSKYLEGKLAYGDVLSDKQINKQMNNSELTCNNDKFDAIDLTREAVNTLNGFDSLYKVCPFEVIPGQPAMSTTSSLSPQKNFFHYPDYKYSGENIFPFSCNNTDNEPLFDGNPTPTQSTNHFLGENFEKYNIQSNDVSISNNNIFAKALSTEDSPEYSSFVSSASIRQNSLFDYEPTTDSFGFPLDKMNNKNCYNKGNDLFEEYSFQNDSYFESQPTDNSSELLCTDFQSTYMNGFLNNNRTFADIAASNVISSGNKIVTDAENCLGAIGDCKSPKSNPMSCSNLNLNNLNAGYFNLFTNNDNLSGTQNVTFYDQANGQTGLTKKSFCVQGSNAFHTSLSPISNKMHGNESLMNEQMNYSQLSMRSNMSMGPMLTSNLSNGPQSSSEMIGLPCDGSNSQNKPTNIMAYKGLWVCNISPDVTLAYLKRRFRRFGHFTGIQTFERRATNGSNIVFVHYDNPYSPVEAISCLHNYTGQDLCADALEPLKLRFAPSMEQSRAGQLPTLEQARKLIERHGECFNWRLSSGCHRGIRCQLKHVPINKEIDSQPWVSQFSFNSIIITNSFFIFHFRSKP